MFPSTNHLSLLCLCLLLPLLWSTGDGICENHADCNSCILLDPECMWCADEGLFRGARCQRNLMGCQDVINPQSEITNQVDVKIFEVSLRQNDTLKLEIPVTTARNIPLDVYILFDLSQSLQEEIDATRSVSDQIIGSLKSITSNVQAGFGSFIDKTVRPFTRTNLTTFECVSSVCYNFRHYGPLTEDEDILNSRFERAQTGSNIDAPEAGLDAIAQVALCDDMVGWRDEAVKIVLYFTDDAFKFAGEGRHAGIIKPFEEVCKLEVDPTTDNFTAYAGLDNDYTSPGQLLKILEETDIVPVFIAVASTTQINGNYNVTETHRRLAELFNVRLNGRASSAEVDGLSTDQEEVAQSILDTIDSQVLAILQRARLIPEEVPGIKTTVEATCPPDAIEEGTGTGAEFCNNVDVGNTANFELSLRLNCAEFGDQPREMRVNVLPQGEVIIKITPICDCNCTETEVNSSRCSFNGNYSCGTCVCNEGYCGLECQISEAEQPSCPTDANSDVCSGDRGSCVGGCQCVCYEDFREVSDDPNLHLDIVTNHSTYGPACECDFFSCLEEGDTEICTGRGECCDGVCICETNDDGYRYRSRGGAKRDCDCMPEEVICRKDPNSTVLCEDRGTCDCEACECPAPFGGEFCDKVVLGDCFDLSTESEAEMCILERKEGDLEENGTCQTCLFDDINVARISCVLIIPRSEQPGPGDSNFAGKIEAFASSILDGNYMYPESPGAPLEPCFFTDEDGCIHVYYILYNTEDIEELIIVAEEQSSCPEGQTSSPVLSIPLWALAIILLGVLLFLGVIILLIIKSIFLLLDYFEVKRLEKEVGLADFSKNQNPLYQSPEMEYKNVAYGKE